MADLDVIDPRDGSLVAITGTGPLRVVGGADDDRAAITVDHLMRMGSGLAQPGMSTDPASPAFQDGGNWVGVLFAVYNGVAAVAAARALGM